MESKNEGPANRSFNSVDYVWCTLCHGKEKRVTEKNMIAPLRKIVQKCLVHIMGVQ